MQNPCPTPGYTREAIVGGPSQNAFEAIDGEPVTFVVTNANVGMTDTHDHNSGITATKSVEVVINEVGDDAGIGEMRRFDGYTVDGYYDVSGGYSTDSKTGWLQRSPE